jgi:quinol monooxygenase YgiN
MLIVLGKVGVDPIDVDAFCEDIAAIDPVKNGVEGCLFYSVISDDRVPGTVIVAERWMDQQPLTIHLQRVTTMSFGQKWEGRMRADVRKYDASNERTLSD